MTITFRVGNGIDAHAFGEGVPLWLGGVHVPHSRGLVGHSDGDATIHALIDALLGAVGRGDIGMWFPSSDERWRGSRSTTLLAHVWGDLHRQGWRLENADLTIVAAEPKVGIYRDAMRDVLATALEVATDRISIKATTTDRLGALGRAEGIAALATVLLSRDESD